MQSRGIGAFRRGEAETRQSADQSAETLAIEVLTWLAGEAEALSRFMSLSGLEAANLRAAAAEPGFLAGVLDFLASDESLLLDFAANAGRDPAGIAKARRALAPPEAGD